MSLTLAPSMAFAQVSQADQDACTPDVFRLCQEFIPDEAPIVACLEAKRVQLSPACGRVMFPPSQQSAAVDEPKTHHARNKVPKKKPGHHAKVKHRKPAAE